MLISLKYHIGTLLYFAHVPHLRYLLLNSPADLVPSLHPPSYVCTTSPPSLPPSLHPPILDYLLKAACSTLRQKWSVFVNNNCLMHQFFFFFPFSFFLNTCVISALTAMPRSAAHRGIYSQIKEHRDRFAVSQASQLDFLFVCL